MIEIKMTGICEGCNQIDPQLEGSSLTHDWTLLCTHESACMRVMKKITEMLTKDKKEHNDEPDRSGNH